MCSRCLRAQRSCICVWTCDITPAAQVLILQHPMETHQAKGSARLLHLCLRDSVLAQGECFGEEALHDLLHPAVQSPLVQPVLLYPYARGESPSRPMPDVIRPGRVRLVVLDATWRKSRKMLHLNPMLQCLPRLPLTDPPSTRYCIRKAQRTGQLSTLEATCHALAQLEDNAQKYQPLLDAFDGFVAQQQRYLPKEHLLSAPQA